MTWLKFKHGTLEKQYNVTIILPPLSVLSPSQHTSSINSMHNIVITLPQSSNMFQPIVPYILTSCGQFSLLDQNFLK